MSQLSNVESLLTAIAKGDSSYLVEPQSRVEALLYEIYLNGGGGGGTGDITRAEVLRLLEDKVDKLVGYGLISDEEAERLKNVDNYDDSEVKGLITDISNSIIDLKDAIKDIADGQFIYDTEAKMTKVVPDGVNKGIVAAVGGKTVKYNQLSYNNANSSEQPIYNIYWYNLGNGLFQAKGTPTTNVVFPLNSGDVVNTTFKANHKYYLMGTKDGSEESYHICIWESSIGYLAYDYGNGAIFNPNKDYDAQFRLRVVSGYDLGTTGVTFKPRLIDLTVMFGSGNEPTTVDDERIIALRAYAEDNPEQTDGELWDAPVTEVVSVGKNLFDYEAFVAKDTSKRKVTGINQFSVSGTYYQSWDVKLKPNTQYVVYIEDKTGSVNSGVIVRVKGSSTNLYAKYVNGYGAFITTSATDYIIGFYSGNATYGTSIYKNVMIYEGQSYDPYVPYNKTTFLLDKIVDKLPDYGASVNDEIYNYIDFEEMVYHHRVGNIAMKDHLPSSWSYIEASKRYVSDYWASTINLKILPTSLILPNIVINNYSVSEWSNVADISKDKTIYISTSGGICVRNLAATTAAQINTLLQDTVLNYELAEEELIPLTDLLLPFKCEPGGTITFENEHNLDVPNTIIYEKEMK